MNQLFSAKTFKAALLVGTLDISAACLHFFIKTGMGPDIICKYIASAFFGKDAFTGGNVMILYGLLMHYCIATSFTIFFFWICSKFPSILSLKFFTGILYGAFIWAVMNLLLVPLTLVNRGPFNIINAAINMAILIVCIGIPLYVIASGNTRSKS